MPKVGILLFDLCICALQLVFLVVSYELAHYEAPTDQTLSADGDGDALESETAVEGDSQALELQADEAVLDTDQDPLLRSAKPALRDPVDAPIITLDIRPTLRRLFVVGLAMVDDKPSDEGGSQARPRQRRRRNGSAGRLSDASDEERNVGVTPSV